MTSRAALETAILDAMDRAGSVPMQWGADDCALWCANILQNALGYDPAKQWRGHYKTRRGAMRALGKVSLLRSISKMAVKHRWKRVHPTLAQTGDVGMAWIVQDKKHVLATVICRSRGWFVGRNELGFSAIPAAKVAVAWSVLPDALPTNGTVSLRKISTRPEMAPTSAVAHEPVSTIIGLTAVIEALGASAAVAGAIGGAIVSVSLSVACPLSFNFQGSNQ